MENRICDREMYEAIKNVFTTGESDIDPTLVIEFCEKKIASIERKKERAKERASEKKAAGDELLEKVKAHLTPEFATAAEITTVMQNEGEECTVAKVRYRLIALAKSGEAIADDIIITKENGKKSAIKAYRLAD